MSALFALAIKDLKVLFRDRMGFVSAFVWPLLIAVFFGSFAPGPGTDQDQLVLVLDLAIADEDGSDASAALVTAMEDHPSLVPQELGRSEAETQIRKGKLAVLVVIPAGYAQAHTAGEPAPVELVTDPRRSAEAGLARGLLTQLAFEQRWGEGATESPIAIEERRVEATAGRPPSPYAITFPQGMMWAVISCTASFGISIVTERSEGTLMRLRVAPLARGAILAGKALAFLLSAAALMTVILGIGIFIFGLEVAAPLKLVAAMTSVALGFTGLMMVLSVLGKTPRAASGVSWAILMVASMLGGAMLPLFMMPPWMQMASKLSPVSWALLALEGAIWREYSWAELAVPCAGLIVFGLACFAFGSAHFKRQD